MAVRRESVRLELQDSGFSTGMARAAAATKLLDAQLADLDGTTVDTSRSTDRSTKSTKEFTLAQAIAAEESARLRKSLRDQARALIDARDGTAALGKDTDRLGKSADQSGKSIDRLSGRIGLLARGFAVLGPTLAPISAVAVAGVAGLASQFGFAATGALSLVAASQGVGDALKAVNEAALKPTAANLEKAREAMAKIGPDAQAFVTRFQEIRPVLNDIRDAAAAGWFPGLTESLTSLERIAPEVASLFEKIGTVGGNLVAEGAAAFAGPGWADFRSFVAAEAPQALDDLGRTLGNVAKGLAELWMAFGPLNSSFSSWMLDASRGFADWAAGLSETEGFQEFIDYVRENGPKVADAAVAIANAVLQIAEAAAPLGGPVLEALTSIANAIATIADSPLGTPIMTAVTAMSALSLATNVATAATLRLKAAQASLGMGGAGSSALAGGAPGLAIAGFASGLTNGIAEIEKYKSGTQGLGESLLNLAPGFRELNILSDQFGLSLPGIAKDADEVSGSMNRLVDSVLTFGGTVESEGAAATRAIKEVQAALTDLNGVLTKQGAFDAYQASLDNLTESVKRNGQTLDANTAAGRENRANLNDIAASAAKYAESLEGADRKRFLQGAIRDFKAGAEAAGGLDARARAVLKGLRDLAKVNVKPKIDANDKPAISSINAVEQRLNALNGKSATVTVSAQVNGAWNKFKGFFSADGSTVPKDGGPYADRYPYMLAPGEEVISNRHGQADRHRPLLKAINAGMLADGGTSGLDGFGFLAAGGTASGKPGKRRKNESAFLGWDLVDQVPMSLKGMIKSLEDSRDALQSETDARTSLVKELGDTVAGKFTSSLFGNTDVWSAGGSLADAIAILNGDTAGANAFTGNVDRLKALGLDDPGALNALLAQADAATIANIAATATPEVIAQYEQSFQARQAAVSAAQGTAMAAQTATLVAAQAATTARMDQVVAELKVLQQIERGAPEKTGHAVGKAGAKGAGKGARNQKRSSLR